MFYSKNNIIAFSFQFKVEKYCSLLKLIISLFNYVIIKVQEAAGVNNKKYLMVPHPSVNPIIKNLQVIVSLFSHKINNLEGRCTI